jgi:hypothetical protein
MVSFTLRPLHSLEITPSTHLIVGLVGALAGLNSVEKTKFTLPGMEPTQLYFISISCSFFSCSIFCNRILLSFLSFIFPFLFPFALPPPLIFDSHIVFSSFSFLLEWIYFHPCIDRIVSRILLHRTITRLISNYRLQNLWRLFEQRRQTGSIIVSETTFFILSTGQMTTRCPSFGPTECRIWERCRYAQRALATATP